MRGAVAWLLLMLVVLLAADECDGVALLGRRTMRHTNAGAVGGRVLQTPLRCPAWSGEDLGMLQAVARRVAGGETVQIRPRGSSMAPIINSRQLVTIRPVDAAKVEVGDVVLARVAGTVYLHLVSAVDRPRRRVQISNNRGRVNGWTSQERVFGICTEVDGVRRPRARGKVRSAAG